MGTLSENQTQEHNKAKNRPGREDLGAGAVSKENARERLRVWLRDRKGLWTCYVAAAPVLVSATGPGVAGAHSLGTLLLPPPMSGAHSPAQSQQAGLIADCEPVVFSFGFCFHVRLPSPCPFRSPSSLGVDQGAAESSPLPDSQGPGSAEMSEGSRTLMGAALPVTLSARDI